MFTSLPSRLWLTYTLLIAFVLAVLGSGILLFYIRPLPIRQTYQFLNLVAQLIQQRSEQVGAGLSDQGRAALLRYSEDLNIRVLLLRADGEVVFDSQTGAGPFPAIRTATLPRIPRPVEDTAGVTWLYVTRQLSEGQVLVVAQPRPQIPLLRVLREEMLPPLMNTGLVAVLLALLLAFAMTRWITGPLKRVTLSTHRLSAGDYRPIPLEGPDEVRQLAQAFNEMAEQVQSSQNIQREFVANVSHELKTPLTSIQGFAQAILDGAASTPEALHQAAAVIHEEAGRMHRLVLDLLDLARIDSGIAAFQHSPLDPAHLLREVIEKVSILARQKEVDLQSTIPPLPALSGDSDRLAQVFTNLLDNAIKYTPPQGQVFLKAASQEGYLEVSVIDSGPGIPAGDLPHLFERFYRSDKSRQSNGEVGFGLGLAIAREIVLAHGGSISAASTPGKGSTFWVRLPFIQPDKANRASKKRSRLPEAGRITR